MTTKKTRKAPAKRSPAKAKKGMTAAVATRTWAGGAHPGIFAAIRDALASTKTGLTKDELLGKLVKAFPERVPEKMLATLRTQLSRQGAKVIKQADGVRRYMKGGRS